MNEIERMEHCRDVAVQMLAKRYGLKEIVGGGAYTLEQRINGEEITLTAVALFNAGVGKNA